MRIGGKVIGIAVILVTVLLAITAFSFTYQLRAQRDDAIQQLVTLPGQCQYTDKSLCPQAEEIVVPSVSGIGFVLVGILLGVYLIMNDLTQRKILDELGAKRTQLGKEERYQTIMSVLTPDEQRIIAAVREQPGISQATLRLRTDMSKAKLSMLLKALEERGLITKVEDGKTNAVHLKREL